jgi:hypothetical protein
MQQKGAPTMNTFVSTLFRDVTCAAAALVITLVLSVAFVQSTAEPYGVHAAAATAQHQA